MGRKIRWDARAVLGFTVAVSILLGLWQIPNYVWVWPWGPNTGYRSAGLSSGHYERRFPAILRGMPMIGMVLVTDRKRLIIDYDLALEEGKASFMIWKWPIISNRSRDVGPRRITSSGQGRIEVAITSAGLYRVFMHAHRLQGRVSVDWHTEGEQEG